MDLNARNALALQYAGIPINIWRKHIERQKIMFQREDCIAEGTLALVVASRKYDPANRFGAGFHTYASRVVYVAMMDFIATDGTIKLSRCRDGRTSEHTKRLIQETRRRKMVTLPAYLASPVNETPEERVSEALAMMRKQERNIIRGHFLEGKTLAVLSDEFGKHREKIRKGIKRVLERVRTKLVDRSA